MTKALHAPHNYVFKGSIANVRPFESSVLWLQTLGRPLEACDNSAAISCLLVLPQVE